MLQQIGSSTPVLVCQAQQHRQWYSLAALSRCYGRLPGAYNLWLILPEHAGTAMAVVMEGAYMIHPILSSGLVGGYFMIKKCNKVPVGRL